MMTSLPANILPCPFHRDPADGCDLNHTSNGLQNIYVTCECGCEGPSAETLEEAVALWNVRAGQEAKRQSEVAQLLVDLAECALDGIQTPTALQGFAHRAKVLLARVGGAPEVGEA